MCQCVVVTERLAPINIDPLLGFYRTQFSGVCEAISIGPRSMLDRCYIMPVGAFPGRNPAVAGESMRNEFASHAIAVSVERPWVGHLEGPFVVFGPYGQDTDLDGVNGTLPWIGGVGANIYGDNADLDSYLDLQFYSTIPHVLPTKRAPAEYLRRYTAFDATALDTLVFPGWGRRRIFLGIEATGIAAGDFTYRVDGVNLAFKNADIVEIRETLQAATTVNADGEASFVYDGEFDLYELTLDEGAALTAGVDVDIIFKAWD